VQLPHSYSNPVVIATVHRPGTAAKPAVPRIRNAAGSRFELRVQQATRPAQANLTVTYNVEYLVVEAGVYTQAQHGIAMEAGVFSSTRTDFKGGWLGQARSYRNTYVNPVVLGQVMSQNDSRWSVFWARGGTVTSPPTRAALRLGKHVGEDSTKTRNNERIGYLILESGQGEVGGVRYQAGVTNAVVAGTGNAPPYTVAHQLDGTLIGAISSAAGMKGGDGGWPVLYGSKPIEGGRLGMAFEEDQMSDLETGHAAEQVAFLVLAEGGGGVEQGPLSDIYVLDFQEFERSELVLSGSATDDDGIASATVSVQNRDSGQWLQPNGTWGAAVARHPVDLSVPGGRMTRWLFRQSLPTGRYLADVEATNSAGVRQALTDRISRRFDVVRDRAALDSGRRWLTVFFSRSMWGAAGGGTCSPYTDPVNGSVFLDEVASFLTPLGYTAQGSVPFGHFDPNPAVRKCPWPGAVSASFNDLALLRDEHDWTFVADSIGPLPSNSSARPAMTALTCRDQIRASTESLAELNRLGHARGWGLIAPPNSLNTGIRDNITSRFYAFTRLYGYNYQITQNTETKALSGDWGYFKSVGGGLCNDSNAECYDHYVSGDYGVDPHKYRYNLPDALLGYAVAAPGAWRGIQFYRLVRGARIPVGYPGTSTSPAGAGNESYWDCTSPDPKRHWVSRPELYCFDDFKAIMERLYWDYPDVITTDTARIATTWGIGNPNHLLDYPICSCQINADCPSGQLCQGGQCK
jgi:hypothetical protein